MCLRHCETRRVVAIASSSCIFCNYVCMFLNRYVLSVVLASVLSALSLFLVLTKLDPFADETLAITLFFISLFFFVSGALTLIGYAFRVIFYRDELFLNHFNVSLRQGIILGFSLCSILGLQILRTLTWWIGLIILLISFLVEIYFVARE